LAGYVFVLLLGVQKKNQEKDKKKRCFRARACPIPAVFWAGADGGHTIKLADIFSVSGDLKL
jgi:hypothetical protein